MGATTDFDATEVALDDVDTSPRPHSAYQSPIMARLGRVKPSPELMARYVPPFQAGEHARESLAAEPDRHDAADLRRIAATAMEAKEVLVDAFTPFVSNLARKEHQRRAQSGGALASHDDLFQEGLIGLLEGLRKYDPEKVGTSITNYLGAWVTVKMRRRTEHLDHSFTVGHTVAERNRRIQAIHSRLQGELRRQPTDAEIIAAWTDPQYVAAGRRMGRKSNQGQIARDVVTIEQLEDYRRLRGRTGHQADLDLGPDKPDQQAQALEPDEAGAGGEQVAIASATREFMAGLLIRTMDLLRVARVQRTVLDMRYGLNGYEESSIALISRQTKVPRTTVSNVADTFTAEMGRPHGAFHQACIECDPDDLLSAGWGRLLQHFGDHDGSPPPVYDVLTEDIVTSEDQLPPPPKLGALAPGQVRAQYLCPRHPDGFVLAYRKESDISPSRPCPRCEQPSRLIRQLVT